MGDLVDKLRDTVVWDHAGYTELHNEAADEIERLTAEVERLRDDAIHNEGVMVALREGYEQRGVEVERLKARAEYSEMAYEALKKEIDGHHSTDEQIDAAWGWCNDPELRPFERKAAELCLRQLNIHRCEGCEGRKGRWSDEMVNNQAWIDCPDCNGRGWRKGGQNE